MKRKLLALMSVSLLLISTASIFVGFATISSTPSSVISQYTCEKGADFIVTVDNAITPRYYAIRGSGSTTIPCGTLVYGGPNNLGGATGTSAQSVLSSVSGSLTTGGSIMLSAGKYPLSSTWTISNSGITIQGGRQAILSSTFTGSAMISLTGNNETLYGFSMNLKGMTSNAGIIATGALVTIQNLNIYGGGNQGIYCFTGSTRCQILDNFITVSGADAIVIHSSSKDIVSRNIILTTNANNGIALVTTTDSIVSDNVIGGTTSSGIALENLGSGPNLRDIIANNVINQPLASGINVYTYSSGVESADNCTIQGNTIRAPSVYGIVIQSGNNIAIKHNTILSPTNQGIVFLGTTQSGINIIGNVIVNPVSFGIGIAPSISANNVMISNNQILNPANRAIDISPSTSASNVMISNNQISGLPTTFGIHVQSTTGCQINNNMITMAAAAAPNIIYFNVGASTSCEIEGNTIIGTGSGIGIWFNIAGDSHMTVQNNYMVSLSKGTQEIAGDDFNMYSGNTFVTVTTPMTLIGTHDIVQGNSGYNPQGFATTTPTFPASATDQQNTNPYTVRIYILTPGTVTAYQITDPSGTAQVVTASIIGGEIFELESGAKIQFTYTVAPTWKWYGE